MSQTNSCFELSCAYKKKVVEGVGRTSLASFWHCKMKARNHYEDVDCIYYNACLDYNTASKNALESMDLMTNGRKIGVVACKSISELA